MKLRILGKGSGYPELGKHHSAYIIELPDKKILLDCGDGTSQQLLKYNLANNEIDHIIISHFHPDHVSGLFLVLQMFYLRKRTKSLKIFLPEKVNEFYNIMNFFYSFPERFTYKIDFLPISKMDKHLDEVLPIFSEHLLSYSEFIKNNNLSNPMKAYSFIFQKGIKKLLISCDIAGVKKFKKYKNEIDLFVIDAFHPRTEELVDFISEMRSTIILSHGLSKELQIIINNNPENFEIADENKIYNI
ncbi:MAG: MBL fold metallo-hydrolase [Candidatus Cloacimonetes bacterium]|nr:MBL fold metallo-hydrolase [Candidatus Cloacimonadota bacterium]